MQVGALTTDTVGDTRRMSVTAKGAVVQSELELDPNTRAPTEAELHGPNQLRRIGAPIPLAVYTVAFVELCERFSYYGTQVVCKYFSYPRSSCPCSFLKIRILSRDLCLLQKVALLARSTTLVLVAHLLKEFPVPWVKELS